MRKVKRKKRSIRVDIGDRVVKVELDEEAESKKKPRTIMRSIHTFPSLIDPQEQLVVDINISEPSPAYRGDVSIALLSAYAIVQRHMELASQELLKEISLLTDTKVQPRRRRSNARNKK